MEEVQNALERCYADNLDIFRRNALSKYNKHTVVLHATRGNIMGEEVDRYIHNVTAREPDVDFQIIKLVRILYMIESGAGADDYPVAKVMNLKGRVDAALSDFPFWPHTHTPAIPTTQHAAADLTPNSPHGNADKLVFWSENHIFMMLSSAYLYQQWKLQANTEAGAAIKELHKSLEAKLLLRYLAAHLDLLFCSSTSENGNESGDRGCSRVATGAGEVPTWENENGEHAASTDSFDTSRSHSPLCTSASFICGGVYEVLSHVYLPFTLSSLLNLCDFALDAEVRAGAQVLADRVATQLMLGATRSSTYACTFTGDMLTTYQLMLIFITHLSGCSVCVRWPPTNAYLYYTP